MPPVAGNVSSLALPSTPVPQIHGIFILLLIFFSFVVVVILGVWVGYKIARIVCSRSDIKVAQELKALEEGTPKRPSITIPITRPPPAYQTKTEYKVKDTRRLSAPAWMTNKYSYDHKSSGLCSIPIYATCPLPLCPPSGIVDNKPRIVVPDSIDLFGIRAVPAHVLPPMAITPEIFALFKLADEIVGHHPAALPLFARVASKAYIDTNTGNIVFPWIPSKGMKIGLVHSFKAAGSLDTISSVDTAGSAEITSSDETVSSIETTPLTPEKRRRPLQEIQNISRPRRDVISHSVPLLIKGKSRRQPGGKENCPPPCQLDAPRIAKRDAARLHPIVYLDRYL